MNTTGIAGEQIGAAGGLLAMLSAFSHLPPIDPALHRFAAGWGVRVSIHNGLTAFERWREALALDPDDVDHKQRGTLAWLTGTGTWSGVRVELVGYYDLPDTTEGT